MSQYIDQTKCTVSMNRQGTSEWLIERNGFITGSRQGTISILLSQREKLNGYIKNGNPNARKQNENKLKDVENQLKEAAKKFCGIIPDIVASEHMEAVQYGLDNEDRLRNELSERIGQTIHQVGFCRFNKINFLGASPDGILENGDIVEIKTTMKPTPEEEKSDFSEIPIGHMQQMQHNMGVMGAARCHYYCYSRTSNSVYYRIIPFDEKEWNERIKMNTFFYNKYMMKFILQIPPSRIDIVKSSNVDKETINDGWTTVTPKISYKAMLSK